MGDFKTWSMRVGTAAVAVGIYVVAERFLAGTGSYGLVCAVAGALLGAMAPQLHKGNEVA